MQNSHGSDLLCYVFFQSHPQLVPVVSPVSQNVKGRRVGIIESLTRRRGEAREGLPAPSISNARVRKSAWGHFEDQLCLYLNNQAPREERSQQNNVPGFLGVYVFIYEQDRMHGLSFL